MRERMQDMGRRLAGPVAVGLTLGLIGPFGTYALLPLLPRLGYWLAIVALNWLLCDIAIRRVDDMVSRTLPLRRVAVPLAGAALVSLPATGVVATANGLSGIGWPESILVLYGQVALLLSAISLPVYTLADLREAAEAAETPSGAKRQQGNPRTPASRFSAPACPDRLTGGSSASKCRTTTSLSTPRTAAR